MKKFESERNPLFSVILGHTLNVILGFIPRIHTEHLSNVILGFIPRIYVKSTTMDTRDTPEYDNRKNFTKGLDVVRQCAALLERLKTHIKINSLFCHPRAWLLARPEDLDSRVKPENDHKRSLIKNLECIETAESGVDKVVSSCEKNPNTLLENLDSVRECAGIFKRRVQKEYTSAKISSRHQLNEFSLGRSMIEMLGVLAIIGVLSVGGIAGYSKAMIKFKTNTLLQQISTIISNTQILYAQQKDHEGLDSETAIQMGIIPAELISSDGKTLVDSFGDEMTLEDWGNHSWIGFVLMMSTKEKCLAVSNADWNVFNPYIVGTTGDVETVSYCSDRYQDKDTDSACDGSDNKVVEKLPFSPSDVAEICSTCSAENPCGFILLTD